MNYKNLMILSLLGLLLFTWVCASNERDKQLNQRSEVFILKQENKALKRGLRERDSVLRVSYDGIKRLEYILHSDTIDGIITYKEKLLVSARCIQEINRMDLR